MNTENICWKLKILKNLYLINDSKIINEQANGSDLTKTYKDFKIFAGNVHKTKLL